MATPHTSFRVELASVPDRDDVVAEVWFDGELFAELRHDTGVVRLQLYDAPSGGRWDLPHDDVVAALRNARERLGASPPERHDDPGR